MNDGGLFDFEEAISTLNISIFKKIVLTDIALTWIQECNDYWKVHQEELEKYKKTNKPSRLSIQDSCLPVNIATETAQRLLKEFCEEQEKRNLKKIKELKKQRVLWMKSYQKAQSPEYRKTGKYEIAAAEVIRIGVAIKRIKQSNFEIKNNI